MALMCSSLPIKADVNDKVCVFVCVYVYVCMYACLLVAGPGNIVEYIHSS